MLKEGLFQIVSIINDKIYINNYIGRVNIVNNNYILIETINQSIVYNFRYIVKINVLLTILDYERYVNKEINITDLHTFAKVRAFTEKDVRLSDINDFKHYCVEKEI
jgi:hypothetical protein